MRSLVREAINHIHVHWTRSLKGCKDLLTDVLQAAVGAAELTCTLAPRRATLAFGVANERAGSAVAVIGEAAIVVIVVASPALAEAFNCRNTWNIGLVVGARVEALLAVIRIFIGKGRAAD